ncbi:MAG TPA: lipid A biosynthesis acyltransferase [Gammaproteobacteria bacterium]|nr:lipid A biosynthesis acyltransferase [Gammaproteobacteria bacterium]
MAEWTEQKERSNPFTLKLICYIALNLSRGFARLLLWPITLYFFISSSTSRFASQQYLRRVHGRSASAWQVMQHIHHFAATILDRVYFLTDQFNRFTIKIHNEACLEKIISSGRGAILLGSHVGSFEVMRCLALNGGPHNRQLPLKILMYQNHNAMITQVLDELNPQIAASVINLADPAALLKMKEALEQGCLIGMLGDRVLESEKSVSCAFMGEDVDFPVGPFKLAAVLNAPVVGFSGIYEGGNHYAIYHELLYDAKKVPGENRNEMVARLTQNYVSNIEKMLKLYPNNWFNFYDYWGDKQ